MIIELFGCPGSGKSFLMGKIVKNKSAARNLDSKNLIKTSIIRTMKKAVVYFPSSIFLKKKIYKVLSKQSQIPVFIDRPMKVWIDNLVMLNFVYRILKKRNLFMDEGLVQRTISMCVNFQWDTNIAINIINLLPGSQFCTPFFLDVSVDDCLKSIKARDRHTAQMDEMDNQLLTRFIECFYKYCEIVTETGGYSRVKRNEYEEIKRLLND